MPQLSLASDFPKATEDDWRALVEKSLKGRPWDSLVSITLDGIGLQPLYRGAAAPAPVLRREPVAGAPPWSIMQRLDISDVGKANAQALEDLENGAGGLVLVWPGSVCAGGHGITVSSLDDLKRLTAGIELDLISLRLEAGRYAEQAVRLVLDLYSARNLDLARCDISFGLDPLGVFGQTGRAADEATLKRTLSACVGAIAERGHRGPAIMVDARVYHGAGATEAQELAVGLASAIQYLRWLEAEGHDLEDAIRRIGFLFTADADQILSIAKLRASRVLWARARAAMGLGAEPAVIHVETAMRMMARRDPHVNLLRTSTAAFAAGVGGADAVTVLPFSAARGLPDGFARRLARGIQTLLQEESGIGRVAEAAAGAGVVEAATAELAAAAWKLFQSIEARGGMLAALRSGFVPGMIAEAAAARRRAVAERRHGLTGVSQFPKLDEVVVEVLDVPLPESWKRGPVDDAIVCPPLVQERLAEPFEALRDAADGEAERSGRRPAVFLANLGPMAEFDAPARWARNFFAAGGIGTFGEEGFDDPDVAARAFRESGASIACLCGLDRGYGELAATTAKALRDAGAVRIYLAGRPGGLEKSGVNEFLYDGIDAVDALQRLHQALGIGKANNGGAA
jgi:methylmalonyl-CoA mutase